MQLESHHEKEGVIEFILGQQFCGFEAQTPYPTFDQPRPTQDKSLFST